MDVFAPRDAAVKTIDELSPVILTVYSSENTVSIAADNQSYRFKSDEPILLYMSYASGGKYHRW